MSTGAHEQERIHQLDHSVSTDVRTPRRHVRTRLYFTSESHIHSLFNVLRWGSSSDGEQPSIFSDAAHHMFQQIELGYLTHIVFRVLLRPRADPGSKANYVVQVLVSPGISHHSIVCDAATHTGQWQYGSHADINTALFDALKASQQLVLASSADLTLEEIDKFFAHILESHEDMSEEAAPGDADKKKDKEKKKKEKQKEKPAGTAERRASRASESTVRLETDALKQVAEALEETAGMPAGAEVEPPMVVHRGRGTSM